MFYLDTSLLVATLTRETYTSAAQQWLASQDPEILVISGWVVTEFSSALSLKVRTQTLDQESRAGALTKFRSLISESLQVLPVVSADFDTAAHLSDQHDSGLRAGDALHLAIAMRYGATVKTLDQTQAKAASLFGSSAELLDPS